MTFSLPPLPLALSLLSLFIFYYICINSSLFGKAISISVSIWCIFGLLRLVSGFRFFHAVLRQLRSCAVHSMLRFSTSNSSKRHFEISIIMSCSFDIELASWEANKQTTNDALISVRQIHCDLFALEISLAICELQTLTEWHQLSNVHMFMCVETFCTHCLFTNRLRKQTRLFKIAWRLQAASKQTSWASMSQMKIKICE